ncbi:MAG TPA: hypothetical protein VGH28_09560 [Polyangiaceae bacterium]
MKPFSVTRMIRLAGALAVVGCGGAARPADVPTNAPQRMATANLDVRRLVLEMARSKACSQLEGKWLGLPGQTTDKLEGADGGLSSSWGRLQIRDCKSTATDDTLSLSFGGVGWTWVDQKSGSVGVKQYVYLTATVEMTSALDIGYDPQAKIASVWLTPTEPLKAHVQALGTIKLIGDGFFGQLEKAAATALGVDPKQQVAAQGAKTFEDALRKGMTMTFDTQSQQIDLLLAPLPNGVVPKRPMPLLARPWLLNERQEVFPGGVQFSGPYDPAPAIELDAKWESGGPAHYGMVCATDATSAADALARGDKPSLVLQSTGDLSSGTFSKVLVPPPCPWVLVTTSKGADASRFALELTPADAPAGSPISTPIASAPSSATVWITVLGFDFEGRKPDGKSWDFGGGAPDPKIWLRAGSGTQLVIVPMMKDTFRASPMLRAPAAVEVSASSPLVVGATDVDEAFDDPMGEATITLDDVLAHREMDVETKLGGLRTGTLHLRLEH